MNRQKIYYVPGLISLLLLPILLVLLGPEEYVRKTAIRLNLPFDHSTDTNIVMFTRDYVLSTLKGKKITTITLDDNPSDDLEFYQVNRKMAYIKTALERLKFNNDTSEVVKVRLTESSTYGDFIWILNHTILYRIKRFVYMDNSIYFFSETAFIPEEHQVVELYLDIYPAQPDDLPVVPPTLMQELKWWWQEQLQVLQYYTRFNKILISGFILLILIPASAALLKKKLFRMPAKMNI